MKKITIAITFYNSFEYLEDAIRIPLFNSRVSEIIILDDCSNVLQFNLLKNKIKSLKKGEKISNDINYSFIDNKYFSYKSNIEYLTMKVVSKLARKISIYRNKKNLGSFIRNI
jgi:GT2 family glycosyltransferase